MQSLWRQCYCLAVSREPQTAAPSLSRLLRRSLATEAQAATKAISSAASSEVSTSTTPSRASKFSNAAYPPAFPSRRTLQPVPESQMERAQRIYLPNLVFRLVRNSPKEANNPYIATFRVPVQLTRPDIVSYLSQVYGLKVTSISTITEMGEIKRNPGNYKAVWRKKNTKKAIIGMEQPFWFPEKRDERWMKDHFESKTREAFQTRRRIPLGDATAGRGRKSWRWRGSSATYHGVGARYSEIIRRIREKRELQESALKGLAEKEKVKVSGQLRA